GRLGWCRQRPVLTGVPAAPVLADLAVALESGEDAVQVVLLDAHLVGELGDGDPGRGLDEVERLRGARAGAPRAPAPARPGRGGGGGAPAPAARRGARRARRPRARSVQRAQRLLETLVLVDRGLEVLQPRCDLLLFLFQEICHGSNCKPTGDCQCKIGITPSRPLTGVTIMRGAREGPS